MLTLFYLSLSFSNFHWKRVLTKAPPPDLPTNVTDVNIRGSQAWGGANFNRNIMDGAARHRHHQIFTNVGTEVKRHRYRRY
jgi:hypothetical protein